MSLYRMIKNGVDHWMVNDGKQTVAVSHDEFTRLWVKNGGRV